MNWQVRKVTWKKDWFSWKPNISLLLNFIKQYSTNPIPHVREKYRIFLKMLESSARKRERKCMVHRKPTSTCITKGSKDRLVKNVSHVLNKYIKWRRKPKQESAMICHHEGGPNKMKEFIFTWNYFFSLTTFRDVNFPWLNVKIPDFPWPGRNWFFPDFLKLWQPRRCIPAIN